ncbi:MAG: transglutaminase domain-containing protein [Thermodesulfovibrionales bacterium]|nr:transglutaminase domain-containing protein [Thermodesulfovibrionales bacterium]
MRKLAKISYFLLFVSFIFLPLWDFAHARTLILEGMLDSKISIAQQIGFSVDRPVSKLSFRFALPANFSNKTVSQNLQGLNIKIDPQPIRVDDETDTLGNHFKIVTWNNLSRDAKVNITFETHIKSELSAMESKVIFPLRGIPQNEMIYLKPTKMVQSNSPEISSLAKKLAEGALTEYEAVTAILNYVADNVKYTFNPPQYDALYTLKTRSGNCQNFAHLSMALLRAAGIPARIVGGISLKQSWKIPVANNSFLVQSMGQGGHAWMEIYFPDLGWLSYDPQQSKQFTSSRHIKQTHGLDSRDINDSWRALPYLPEYSEIIDAKFLDDTVSLKLKSSDKAPKSYILSNNLLAKAEVFGLETKKPPVEDKPIPPVETKEPPVPIDVMPKPTIDRVMEFGNIEFPNLVDIYQIVGDKGVKILDKETTEYVTSRYAYAQAFETDEPITIKTISLAMRKFGGDGTVYIDLVSDDNGKPSLMGIRSLPIFIEDIKRRPGYYWVDFTFQESGNSTVLKKGRYWIVLRHSGEVIMNWFYIPGNPYGDSDDTRSTLKGYQWEDIQNYDFVFKVRGIRM